MKIHLKWIGNIGFNASTRQFNEILIDEPAEFHGDDRGPSSVEYLGISIGGCIGTSFAYCLKRMELNVDEFDVDVDVKMTHVESEEGNPLRIVKINVNINVKLLDGDDDEDLLNLCIKSVKKYCVVTQSIMRGIPVEISVNKA
ncbi:MAG: OsmC family protein [Promethearchaeota archaeon]